jgi:hypothetical protein
MPSFFHRCAVIASLCVASAAQAGEVTLYEHPGFEGRQLTLRGTAANFASIGFNDRASSAVVVSGVWEFCSDAEFRGFCQTFGRGEYIKLDPRLEDKVSSAREAGPVAQAGPPGAAYGQGAIQLFGQPEFGGRDLQLTGDAAELGSRGFNNRASSVIVTAGTWELCSEPEFRGTCRRYAPGRYAELGYEMTKEISSARLVRSAAQAPAVIGPGHGGGRRGGPPPAGRAILYSEPGLRGSSLTVAGPVGDLEASSFSGVAESLYVESGSWLLCSREFFRGQCRVFGPGRYDDLVAQGFRRSIASIRPGDGEAAALPPPAGRPQDAPQVELFSEPDFGGARFEARRDTPNLDPLRFNDRAGSLIIHTGSWELCSDADYGGRCAVFAPGRYARIGGLTRQLSSFRRVE